MYVITTCSSRNSRFCHKLGADVTIDYVHHPSFLEDDERLGGGGRGNIDVIFDPFSWLYRNRTFQSPLPIMKPDGWYIDVASSPHSLAQAATEGMIDPLGRSIPEESWAYKIHTGCFLVFNSLANVGTTAVQTVAGALTTVADSCAAAVSRAEAGSDSDIEFDDYEADSVAFAMRPTADTGTGTAAAANRTSLPGRVPPPPPPPPPPLSATATAGAASAADTAAGTGAGTGYGSSSSIFPFLDRCKELTRTYGTHQQYQLLYTVKPSARHLRYLARLARGGLVLPVVSRSHVYPFTTEGIRTAHDIVESGHTRGKVVIAVSCTAGVRGGGLGIGSTAVLWEETKAQ